MNQYAISYRASIVGPFCYYLRVFYVDIYAVDKIMVLRYVYGPDMVQTVFWLPCL